MTAPSGTLFYEMQAKPLSSAGIPMAGAYYLFFVTSTLTPANVYADGLLTVPLSQTPGQAQPSCTADASGRFNPIYLNPNQTYRVRLFNASNALLEDVDPYVPAANVNTLIGSVGNGNLSLTDGVGSVNMAYSYVLSPAGVVTLTCAQAFLNPSNNNTLSASGLPAAIIPVTGKYIFRAPFLSDAGLPSPGATNGMIQVTAGSSSLLFWKDESSVNSWSVGAGFKGTGLGFTITYPLNGINSF